MAAGKKKKGETPTGVRFTVPYTPDLLETLLSPSKWGPAELLAVLLCFLVPFLSLVVGHLLPLWMFVSFFLFWRCAYNFGLGLILFTQSQDQLVTKFVSNTTPSTRALLNWIATRSLPGKHSWESAPAELNAWLLFRALALVVLVGDGTSYVSLCARSFQRPTSIPLFMLFSSIGIGLIWFSVWTKKKAHDALGDYAWYWGDFFFTQNTTLVRNGIFSVAPHPMYTLGYITYYGSALVTRSHTLLAVSIIAHAMQIAFLVFVEEPHMQKLYGNPIVNGETNRKTSTSSTEITPVPPANTPADELASALANPILLPIVITVTLIGFIVLTNPNVYLLLSSTLISTVSHWIFVTLVLTQQSASETWTRTLAREGLDARSAYQRWRNLYILSHSVNRALIFGTALCMPATIDSSWILIPSASAWSRIVVTFTLFTLSFYGTYNASQILGDFGSCYSDFFLPVKKELQYSGVFTYLNHPLCVTQYLAYYAAAVYRRSWILAAIIAFAQLLNVSFVTCVEIPHMKRHYKNMRECSSIVIFTADLVSTIIDFSPRLLGTVIDNFMAEQEKIRGKVMVKLCQGAALGCEKVMKMKKLSDAIEIPVSFSAISSKITKATISKSMNTKKLLKFLRKIFNIVEVPESKVEKVKSSRAIKQE